MSTMNMVGWAFCAGTLLAGCVVAIAMHGWRSGLSQVGATLLRGIMGGGVPLLIQASLGDVAAWCSLAVVVPAVWFGRDSLGMLNFLVLQWFGVRLARVEVPGVMRARTRRPVRAGELVTEHNVDMATAEPVRRVRLQRWVWPLTGWWSPQRWIARRP